MTKKKTKSLETRTKTVRLTDKKLTDILPYLFDVNFIGTGPWIRTGDRKFSVLIYLQKKTTPK